MSGNSKSYGEQESRVVWLLFYVGGQGDLIKKVTFEQRSQGSEGGNRASVQGERVFQATGAASAKALRPVLKEQQGDWCGWSEVTQVGEEKASRR